MARTSGKVASGWDGGNRSGWVCGFGRSGSDTFVGALGDRQFDVFLKWCQINYFSRGKSQLRSHSKKISSTNTIIYYIQFLKIIPYNRRCELVFGRSENVCQTLKTTNLTTQLLVLASFFMLFNYYHYLLHCKLTFVSIDPSDWFNLNTPYLVFNCTYVV